MTDQKIENLFFGKLANKLEELYPKHISKERSTALVFNAFANMIFKECIAEVRRETIEEMKEEIKHEQQKMLDGFSHPKDCEMCKRNIFYGNSDT